MNYSIVYGYEIHSEAKVMGNKGVDISYMSVY